MPESYSVAIISSIVSSVLTVVLTILGTRLYEKRKERNQSRQIVQGLRSEIDHDLLLLRDFADKLKSSNDWEKQKRSRSGRAKMFAAALLPHFARECLDAQWSSLPYVVSAAELKGVRAFYANLHIIEEAHRDLEAAWRGDEAFQPAEHYDSIRGSVVPSLASPPRYLEIRAKEIWDEVWTTIVETTQAGNPLVAHT